MCDTIIATGDTTKDGVTIFGKNSDREPNEAHYVVSFAAADHASNSRVQCTYVEIPQAKHTFAILLAKPFWIWGAEMGANEHGLVMGNEALFTKVPYTKKGLLGMDLLRLALERASCAREGITVITDLLAVFGQGGNAGLAHPTYYHNSYILADPNDAWVLETVGRYWAAKQIKGIYSISNGITIEKDWDLASPKLVSHAIKQGWCKNESDFNFARCYSDFLYTRFSDCHKRRSRTMELLNAKRGDVTIETMMSVLRDHGQADGSQRSADEGLGGADVCMHAGFGPIRISQTTGSMVSYLDQKAPLHFVTGTAAPCTSIFKPVWIDAFSTDDFPPQKTIIGPNPNEIYNPDTLFWRHEVLHRTTLHDHMNCIQTFASDRDALEREFVSDAFGAQSSNAKSRAEVTDNCFSRANAAEKEWLKRVQESPSSENRLHASVWAAFNREAKIPQETLFKEV
jgi:secernin